MIAVDWGTTSFRAYRLDSSGTVGESRSAASGILSVTDGNFAGVLEQHVADWLADGEARILMSGMIGSRQGWVEVPYAACPAGLDEIAAGMRRIDWPACDAWIAPGLSCRDAAGVPDVMRGEETQILGILDQLGTGKHSICLPGTHSKWVEIENSRIARFSTHMTGEAFAVFKTHSILGRMMKDGVTDRKAFTEGVRRSADAGGLLHHLFGVRARSLFDELPETASPSYLSGLLIGHEIHASAGTSASAGGRPPVHLLCTAQLADFYGLALSALGLRFNTLDANLAAAGLFLLASRLKP